MRPFLLFILMLAINCQGEKLTSLPLTIRYFYTQNKEKDFNNFVNWHISPRDKSDDAYIFDFFENDKIKYGFIVISNGQEKFKKIFPSQDSSFYNLTDNELEQTYPINLSLFKEFKALNINSLLYIPENNLFLFKLNDYSIIYSVDKMDDITNIKRFSNYKSIDSNWFYIAD